jgi:phosphatidate cytidylyltransferase
MTNLTQRLITGSILVVIISFSICWNVYSFIFSTLAIDLLALLEFYRIIHSPGLSPIKWGGVLLSSSLILTCALTLSRSVDPKLVLINIPITFVIFLSELFRRESNPLHNLAFTFLGVLGITVPICFFITVAFFPLGSGIYHSRIPLQYFLILWASDSGAYLAGKAFGVHPLFKRVSPKKTWEGSLGGAVCALFVAYLISRWHAAQNAIGWMSLAMIIVVTGTFGDLIKSLMKRSLNLKDSGTILPGHGGMLDRFDSLMGSAPFVFCYFVLFR